MIRQTAPNRNYSITQVKMDQLNMKKKSGVMTSVTLVVWQIMATGQLRQPFRRSAIPMGNHSEWRC